jgi:hypothetical protein
VVSVPAWHHCTTGFAARKNGVAHVEAPPAAFSGNRCGIFAFVAVVVDEVVVITNGVRSTYVRVYDLWVVDVVDVVYSTAKNMPAA